MEELDEMVCPRITKCGHIYCWACILSYLNYEKKREWKKCPLCADSIYPRDLKNVVIRQNQLYRVGHKIKFDLMVRSKSNNLVKNKYIESQIISKVEELKKKQEEGKEDISTEEQ